MEVLGRKNRQKCPERVFEDFEKLSVQHETTFDDTLRLEAGRDSLMSSITAAAVPTGEENRVT